MGVAAVEQTPRRSLEGPRPLPSESLLALLELLDASSLARLRRACRFDGLAREAHLAELTGKVLELLCATAFPFTHAAYVLGLNGPYYSYDTIAEGHYGIPKALPPLLCRLFRLAVPGVPFTTVRMQKLAAAANFNGRHRTLAFSLATPPNVGGPDEGLPPYADDSPSSAGMEEEEGGEEHGGQGYALFLSTGCSGGRGEVCEDIQQADWRVLGTPSRAAKWVPFRRSAWLQWHWPHAGDLFAVTVTCEPPSHRNQLTQRERRRMAKIGFSLPGCGEGEAGPCTSSEDDEEASAAHQEGPSLPAGCIRGSTRRSAAAVEAARRLLGFPGDGAALPHAAEVEEAFRRAVRAVHPDRCHNAALEQADLDAPTGISSRMRGWAVAQLTWARRVLREAAEAGLAESPTAEEQAPREILMLNAPP